MYGYAYRNQWMRKLFRLLKPSDLYYRHWLWFHRGLEFRFGGGIAFIFFPMMILFGVIVYKNSEHFEIWAAVTGGLSVLITGVVMWLLPLRCPRCQLNFYRFGGDVCDQERCQHCHLQLYAPHNAL
jgi:hypothetical protein